MKTRKEHRRQIKERRRPELPASWLSATAEKAKSQDEVRGWRYKGRGQQQLQNISLERQMEKQPREIEHDHSLNGPRLRHKVRGLPTRRIDRVDGELQAGFPNFRARRFANQS